MTHLSLGQQKIFHSQVGKLSIKQKPAYYREAFFLCLDFHKLDFKTALSRLVWLDRNDYFESKGKKGNPEKWRPEELAALIAHPKKKVLDSIAENGLLGLDELEAIYGFLRRENEPSSLSELTEERILDAMRGWILDLHLPRYYFERSSSEDIARHILLNRGHRLQTRAGTIPPVQLHLRGLSGSELFWFDEKRQLEIEEQIETDYYAGKKIINISCYRLQGGLHPSLFLYLAENRADQPDAETYEQAGPSYIVKKAPMEIRRRHEALWKKTLASGNIEVETSFKKESGEYRFMVAFPKFTIRHFFSNVTRVLRRKKVEVTRKYVSSFGGPRPVLITACYSKKPFPDEILGDLISVSLYPPNRLAGLVNDLVISPQEANFGSAAVYFLRQFMTHPVAELSPLHKKFPGDHELGELLRSLQRKSDKDSFVVSELTEILHDRPDLLREATALFSGRFHPSQFQRELEWKTSRNRFVEKMEGSVSRERDKKVWEWLLVFIDSVERTNFFLPYREALSFRLKKGFLSRNDYEAEPHGVFLVVSKAFYGFHVRFEEIARGGVRILHSRTEDQLERNARSLFEECFHLAWTQQKKNKDIPEGGAKGVILLTHLDAENAQAMAESAFKKYIDAVLDLCLPAGEKHIRFFPKSPEILFFGPDEGTADLMDWASERSRERGYPHWVSFTTGKSARLGGISHIDYGITTRGVRTYVRELLRTLKIPEKAITKVQTGGPDGDLGSNEILFSRDKTIAIIDGGGVLFDPRGLDRVELKKLAKKRVNASHFPTRLLSREGFLVRAGESNIRLPDGEFVANGETFRNQFHLHPKLRADLFVPCGGRPKSVNLSNWEQLLDGNGAPRFRWVVEGANLFFTQEARVKLEEKGLVLFKDSSANKGGVTSSSLEVLAGLALPERLFFKHLCVTGKKKSLPRETFIREVCRVIEENARLEFQLLWREHTRTGKNLSLLSDELSERIIAMTAEVRRSGLTLGSQLRRKALERHFPETLLKLSSMKNLEKNIPKSYLESIVCRVLAKEFVYQKGLSAGYEDYRRFMEEPGFGQR